MKIAIIGSGISGLTCGWLLHQQHEITLFEAGDYVGGHTNTVDFELDGQSYSVDTGFIVCNDRTYPNFLSLIDHLGVARSPSPMTFSVRCDAVNLEYCGSGLGGLFAQRRNLLRPRFLKMFADILKFNREGGRDADVVDHDLTVGDYLSRNGYSAWFAEKYLLPMGASIWSCPLGTFREFPIRFILEFYRHHGLLSINDRPTWYTIDGGSKNYVEALIAGFKERIQLNSPVKSVLRNSECVTVQSLGRREDFDEVIFACHADQAINILERPSEVEQEILAAFPYQSNEAVLHTDITVLPRRRSVWSAWNYRVRSDVPEQATLTYDMNQLQHLKSPHQFCVSLNDGDQIDSGRMIERFQYAHPVFTTNRHRMQSRHEELIRRNRTSFCGAYWGNGFHEDGVTSGLAVCRKFGASDVLDIKLSGRATDRPDEPLMEPHLRDNGDV